MNKYKFLKKYVQTKYHSLYREWSYIQLVEYFNVGELNGSTRVFSGSTAKK